MSNTIIIAVREGKGWKLRYKHGNMIGGYFSATTYKSKREAESNII